MSRLSSSEIDTLVEEYHEKQDEDEREIEERLEETLLGASFLSRSQTEDIIRWKTLTQGGRADRFIGNLQQVSDEEIAIITNAGLSVNYLRTQIDVFRSLPGVGTGIATAILGFVYPATHVVVDYNVYNGVYDEKKESVSVSQAVQLINRLRSDYKETGHTLRDVDRALFVKYGGFE